MSVRSVHVVCDLLMDETFTLKCKIWFRLKESIFLILDNGLSSLMCFAINRTCVWELKVPLNRAENQWGGGEFKTWIAVTFLKPSNESFSTKKNSVEEKSWSSRAQVVWSVSLVNSFSCWFWLICESLNLNASLRMIVSHQSSLSDRSRFDALSGILWPRRCYVRCNNY